MNDRLMKRFLIVALLVVPSVPAMAKTHKDMFEVSCTTLWPAVKDVLRNSGKYGIIGIDNTEMTASYNIGGFLAGKRINSLVLNAKDKSCEMQVQTSYSGLVNNDAGDFKKRVEESLEKLKAAAPEKPKETSTESPKQATPEKSKEATPEKPSGQR
jgi:hypothetical protein